MEDSPSSPEGSTWINRRARDGSGRISRCVLRRWSAVSSSSSESESVDEEDDEVEVEDEEDEEEVSSSESLVSLPLSALDDDFPLARRCSKTPRPRF